MSYLHEGPPLSRSLEGWLVLASHRYFPDFGTLPSAPPGPGGYRRTTDAESTHRSFSQRLANVGSLPPVPPGLGGVRHGSRALLDFGAAGSNHLAGIQEDHQVSHLLKKY